MCVAGRVVILLPPGLCVSDCAHLQIHSIRVPGSATGGERGSACILHHQRHLFTQQGVWSFHLWGSAVGGSGFPRQLVLSHSSVPDGIRPLCYSGGQWYSIQTQTTNYRTRRGNVDSCFLGIIIKTGTAIGQKLLQCFFLNFAPCLNMGGKSFTCSLRFPSISLKNIWRKLHDLDV